MGGLVGGRRGLSRSIFFYHESKFIFFFFFFGGGGQGRGGLKLVIFLGRIQIY